MYRACGLTTYFAPNSFKFAGIGIIKLIDPSLPLRIRLRGSTLSTIAGIQPAKPAKRLNRRYFNVPEFLQMILRCRSGFRLRAPAPLPLAKRLNLTPFSESVYSPRSLPQ